MYSQFIESLKQEIHKGLPGWEAQKKMAPPGREKGRYNLPDNTNARQSGVLIWLYPQEERVYTRLILRAEFGVHSGQVAFPGGQVEQIDGSLWNTALREANEEVGLIPDNVIKVGELTPLYIPPSNFWVHPFIGAGEEAMLAAINKAEVQKYFDVDIMQLLNPDLKGEKPIIVTTGAKMIVPFYNLEGYTVWGATAMMLSELEELIRRVLKL